jgi:hypothetical protein
VDGRPVARIADRPATRFRDDGQALEVLDRVDVDKLSGSWRASMLLARGRGHTLDAAGRTDKALATYRALLADESIQPNYRKAAEEAIKALETKQGNQEGQQRQK